MEEVGMKKCPNPECGYMNMYLESAQRCCYVCGALFEKLSCLVINVERGRVCILEESVSDDDDSTE